MTDIEKNIDFCKKEMYKITAVPADRLNKSNKRQVNPTYIMLGIGLLLQILTFREHPMDLHLR